MLRVFDIRFRPHTTIKGQILADLVAEFIEELDQVNLEEARTPEEEVRMNLVLAQQTWYLFIDEAANQKGSRVGIVVISP